ncbi:hypothetical protein RvY_10560-3 [Ramazzottius varieornatus]|nr:hypothetical protein RvY_10560-3 [Ramazzottius varieornatus]
MVEAEMAFLDNFDGLLFWMENMLKSVTEKVLQTAAADFKYHMDHVAPKNHTALIEKMAESSFVRVPYDEAMRILEKHSMQFNTPPKKGENLHRDHEVFLVKHCGDVPVFVTEFLASCKPFYAREMTGDRSKVLAADLVVPEIGELFGGSLREHRYDVLRKKCQSAGQLETLGWYLELRKLGCPPCGGFGMGFERYVQFLLGIPSIKDAIPYPRWIDHCAL